MMGVGVRRVVPLTLGWVDVPKSVSVDGASGEPLLAALAGAGLDLADIRAVADDGATGWCRGTTRTCGPR